MILLRFAIAMLALTLLAGAMSYSAAQSDQDRSQAEAVTR
jgi:hypothetical protein